MKIDDLNKYNSNGEPHGDSIYYHWNGNIKYKGNYINGKQSGYWEYYFIIGGLKSKGSYYNDEACGYWEYYNQDGEIYCKEYHIL